MGRPARDLYNCGRLVLTREEGAGAFCKLVLTWDTGDWIHRLLTLTRGAGGLTIKWRLWPDLKGDVWVVRALEREG